MINAKSVKELQILALKAVEMPSWDDWYRRICRWYSKEFSTPIADVYGLAEEEVFQSYFEDQFYTMKQHTDDEGVEAYGNLKDSIINGDEVQAIEEQVEAEDDEWMQKELDKAAKDHNAALAAKEASSKPNLEGTEESEEVFVRGEDSSDFLNDDDNLEDD